MMFAVDSAFPKPHRKCRAIVAHVRIQRISIRLHGLQIFITVAGVYETLLNEYIVKPTAWWTMVELYPMLMYKHDNGNLVTRQSENTTAISKGEMDALIDKARENANWYTQRLVDYLCANNADYPEYSSNNWPDIHPLRKVNRQSTVAFSQGYSSDSPWSRFNVRDFTN